MESKGIIKEPDPAYRPVQPSQRNWGKHPSYRYVELMPGTPDQISFEGSDYKFVAIPQKPDQPKFYLVLCTGNSVVNYAKANKA